ncbi:MAG: hypothetical protein V3V62_07940 [bacterium]
MTLRHSLVHIGDVDPENMDAGQGWNISEFRLPITKRHGSRSAVFHARLQPGAAHKKHHHTRCEEILFCLAGRGTSGLGAGSMEETGYIYAGDVTEADLGGAAE